jgi:hypothetical protein
MLCRMVANKKPPKRDRRRTLGHTASDVHQIVALHVQATQARDELLEQARTLQAAGLIRDARAALNAAEAIQQRLTELETHVRRPHGPT